MITNNITLFYKGPKNAKELLFTACLDYILQTPNFIDTELEYQSSLDYIKTTWAKARLLSRNDLLTKYITPFRGFYNQNYIRKIALYQVQNNEDIQPIKEFINAKISPCLVIEIDNARIKREVEDYDITTDFVISYKGNEVDLFKEAYRLAQLIKKIPELKVRGVKSSSAAIKYKYMTADGGVIYGTGGNPFEINLGD